MKNVVGFKALIGKDKVYVDVEKICAIAYAEAARQSNLNGGMMMKTAVTQIIFTGGHVLTTEKMDEVRRKIGWMTLDAEADERVA